MIIFLMKKINKAIYLIIKNLNLTTNSNSRGKVRGMMMIPGGSRAMVMGIVIVTVRG